MISRRNFLTAMLAASCGPAIVRASSRMPVVSMSRAATAAYWNGAGAHTKEYCWILTIVEMISLLPTA